MEAPRPASQARLMHDGHGTAGIQGLPSGPGRRGMSGPADANGRRLPAGGRTKKIPYRTFRCQDFPPFVALPRASPPSSAR